MAHKICFINQKGGVGKTTLTFHTSGALAKLGIKVLAVDLDAQGNLSSSFLSDEALKGLSLTINDILKADSEEIAKIVRKTAFKRIDLIPANDTLRDLDARLASKEDSQYYLIDELPAIENKYDYILIDCPPSLGKATRIALVASDYVIIPIECDDYSLEGSNRIVNYILEAQKRANPKLQLIGFVINKLNLRRAIEQEYREIIREQYDDTLFRTEIKDSVKFREAPALHKPINFYRQKSEEAEIILSFAKEILDYVNTKR